LVERIPREEMREHEAYLVGTLPATGGRLCFTNTPLSREVGLYPRLYGRGVCLWRIRSQGSQSPQGSQPLWACFVRACFVRACFVRLWERGVGTLKSSRSANALRLRLH
jgi:hypothetical protein